MGKALHEWIARGAVSEEIAKERGYIELVRCKDCKHCFVEGDNVKYNVCDLLHNKIHSGDWFCADGEKSNVAK